MRTPIESLTSIEYRVRVRTYAFVDGQWCQLFKNKSFLPVEIKISTDDAPDDRFIKYRDDFYQNELTRGSNLGLELDL
jgi:hypothetical protein